MKKAVLRELLKSREQKQVTPKKEEVIAKVETKKTKSTKKSKKGEK